MWNVLFLQKVTSTNYGLEGRISFPSIDIIVLSIASRPAIGQIQFLIHWVLKAVLLRIKLLKR
jgi:hypothetical protein